MTEWITDRQPTKEDEDRDGEVLMRRFPDGRNSSSGLPEALVAAAHVGPGVPWKHTGDWEPPATPEPEPEAPQPAPKPELRVGQVWRRRGGNPSIVTILHKGPWQFRKDSFFTGDPQTGEWAWVDTHGIGFNNRMCNDLIELISDAPAEAAQPEPAPTTRKVPRGFSAFYDMPENLNGGPKRIVIAIATDGTAWSREPYECGGSWTQIEPLPDREEPIDA